ncbi:DNA2/NAM7 helicase helicase domain-containing protein OS=Streptomyces fumanus OX=67302 GN=GCM10018772_67360 PE=4 SV=1 [Streptomyces fumanus]
MSAATVVLRAPLVLVPGLKLDEQLRSKSRSSAGLPTEVPGIVDDLNQLPDGVAASLDLGHSRHRPSLLVHTRAYRLRLEATNRGTGYFIKHIDPLRLADHARLARSCLLVRPPSWRMVFELRAVPDGSDAQWETLAEAWQRLGRTRAPQPDAAAVSDAQAQWLGTVDRLIDMTEEHSVREERETAPFPYQRVRSTGGRRNSTTPQSMYEFRLLGPALPPAGAFVRVQGDLETRGRVHRAAEGSVTVRFDQPVSWDRLPERGALELVPSTVVFSKQRQAVASLRTGDTENPHLLRAMVDHRVRGIPPTGARPRERLDPEQTDAFRKALTTEDLLVVLGPP